MIKKEDPKVSNDELALLKVTSWTSYKHEFWFEQTTIPPGSDHILPEQSEYKREAMKKAKEDSTHYLSKTMLRTTHVGSSLLDMYEIERISNDLDHYIRSSCERYYHRKSVDGCDNRGKRIESSSSSLERDSSVTKHNKTIKETKWFGFKEIYKLCGSNEGGVVKNRILKIEDMNRLYQIRRCSMKAKKIEVEDVKDPKYGNHETFGPTNHICS